MKRIFKYLAFSALFLFLFSVKNVAAANISAPTILSVEEELIATSSNGTIIKGLTPAETQVDIYIDNIYQGAANVNSEGGITDNFYFQVKLDFTEGVHTISAVAWDKEFRNNSDHSKVFIYEVKAPAAPTLIMPNEESVVSKVKPKIIGLSKTATFVHFYIDGVYNGKSKILYNKSGVANFAYTPFLNLSREKHIVWAVAEDIHGRKSGISNILKFTVEEPAVSPTLLKPVINNNSSLKQPFIVGLVKNYHRVQVYIDQKLNGEFMPAPHTNGTANFAYKPFHKLTPGKHIIYAVAIDERGKESFWSNIIHYVVPNPRVSEVAASEKVTVKSVEYNEEKQSKDRQQQETMRKIEAIQKDVATSSIRKGATEEKINKDIATSSTQGEATEEKINLDEIITDDSDSTATTTGAINENKEKQNKLQTNIAVFSLFLLAVIAWIFWVNRELIKEKQKEEDSNKKTGLE